MPAACPLCKASHFYFVHRAVFERQVIGGLGALQRVFMQPNQVAPGFLAEAHSMAPQTNWRTRWRR